MPELLNQCLRAAVQHGGTDLVLSAAERPRLRVHGQLAPLGLPELTPESLMEIARFLAGNAWERAQQQLEYDGAYTFEERRLRINLFCQRGSWGAVIRLLKKDIPEMESLGLPPLVRDIPQMTGGMVIVTGPTGSGKSTTLASVVGKIVHTRAVHVITIEDPVEYVYPHGCAALVEQREVGNDTLSFSNALRAALRENPDVILIGELRDLESIRLAITAAETGHLVFGTLHTEDAAGVPGRLIGAFPEGEQSHARVQIAATLRLVIAQRLLPAVPKGFAAAFELMAVNSAVGNMIRQGHLEQLRNEIATKTKDGMLPFAQSFAHLLRGGVISEETAMRYAPDLDQLLGVLGRAQR